MTTPTPHAIAERLRDLFDGFEHDVDGTITQLAELYDPAITFRDPLQTLRGRDAFLAMNRRIAQRARRLSFEVHDAIGGAESLFLVWTMNFVPHRGPTIVFKGSTHARVRDGRIVEQRDYWDLLSSFAQSVPFLRGAYAALTPHLG